MSHEVMVRYTDIDYEREMAFIANAHMPDGGHPTLGVVRTIEDEPGKTAEFAIVVRSDMKHQGLGRALTGKAIKHCRSHHVERLVGLVLPYNRDMVRFVKDLGFTTKLDADANVIEATLELT